MENLSTLLLGTPLFCGMEEAGLSALLAFLAPRRACFRAGQLIFLAGYEEQEIGVVLAGAIEAERTTAEGDSLPITRMGPGGVFGDVLAGSSTPSPVTVTAAVDCEVLFFSHSRLFADTPDAPAGRSALLRNLVASISDKYFSLSRRLDLLLIRSLRGRVVSFLTQSGAQQTAVTLPMNKTKLAAYLACDRAALCRELSRMQRDGLLTVDKNTYRLTGGSFSFCDQPGR